MKQKKSNSIIIYVKQKRKQFDLTQTELADKAGVGLRFVRDMEQGKLSLRMDKVNDVLKLFGAELGPTTLIKTEENE